MTSDFAKEAIEDFCRPVIFKILYAMDSLEYATNSMIARYTGCFTASLYPPMNKLIKLGLVEKSEWLHHNGRRGKFFQLTDDGRKAALATRIFVNLWENEE